MTAVNLTDHQMTTVINALVQSAWAHRGLLSKCRDEPSGAFREHNIKRLEQIIAEKDAVCNIVRTAQADARAGK
jgi:hypothetical protein